MSITSVLSEIRKNPSCFTWGPVKEIIDVGRYTFLHVVTLGLGKNAKERDCGYYVFVDGASIHKHASTIEQAMVYALAYGSYPSHSWVECESLALACTKLLT